MRGRRRTSGSRKARIGIALVCVVAALVFAVAVATGTSGDSAPAFAVTNATGTGGASDSPEGHSKSSSGDEHSPIPWVTTKERVQRHEALPCTGPKDPINFEIFSGGPSVDGMRMTSATRRCDQGLAIGNWSSNEFTYSYGRCRIPHDATGCELPLAIQTWPACQRSLADYSYDGKPIPYTRLPNLGGAEVVEIELPFEHRLEVYTSSVTVVIFSINPTVARRALKLLTATSAGRTPGLRAANLSTTQEANLAPPTDGAVKGELQCHT